MEFKLTIGATPELLAAIHLLVGATSKPEVKPEVKPEPKAEPKPDKKAPLKPDPKPEPKTQPKEFEGDEPITLEAIRKRTGPLTQAGKKDHLKRALSFYGVEKLTDLAEKDYPAFCLNLDQIEAGTPLVNPNDI